MHPSEQSILPFSAWPAERLELRLQEYLDKIPRCVGIWLPEDLYWACVFHIEPLRQTAFPTNGGQAEIFFEYKGRNFYCG